MESMVALLGSLKPWPRKFFGDVFNTWHKIRTLVCVSLKQEGALKMTTAGTSFMLLSDRWNSVVRRGQERKVTK